MTWVRPLHSIVATFGPETEDPDIVPFDVDGIAAGNETRGHRFMAPQPFTVRRLADYQQKLGKAKEMCIRDRLPPASGVENQGSGIRNRVSSLDCRSLIPDCR